MEFVWVPPWSSEKAEHRKTQYIGIRAYMLSGCFLVGLYTGVGLYIMEVLIHEGYKFTRYYEWAYVRATFSS